MMYRSYHYFSPSNLREPVTQLFAPAFDQLIISNVLCRIRFALKFLSEQFVKQKN